MALAEIELPESAVSTQGTDKDSYRLHPALLDGALQVGLSAMPDASAETYLPVGIEELRVLGSPSGSLWALARLTGSDENTVTMDVILLDGEGVTARVISGVASHIQVEETEALHVSRIALMVRGYLRSECVKELLSQAQDSSLTHSTLQLRATMSAIRHPCLIMGQCPSNFEGRNRKAPPLPKSWGLR